MSIFFFNIPVTKEYYGLLVGDVGGANYNISTVT